MDSAEKQASPTSGGPSALHLNGPLLFVGGGQMAAAIIKGLLSNGVDPAAVAVLEPDASRAADLAMVFKGLSTCKSGDADVKKIVSASQLIVLAVKPQHLPEALATLEPGLSILCERPEKKASMLVISVAAGVRAVDLSTQLGLQVVRAMPNTPAKIGCSVTGLFALPEVSEKNRSTADALFRAIGKIVWVDDERHMDAVTAISGSGPAYVFLCMEAILQTAKSMGLSEEQAKALTLETFYGATQLARQTEESPTILREQVTSPGGTTARAISVMETEGLRDIFSKALTAAYHRAIELGDTCAAHLSQAHVSKRSSQKNPEGISGL